MEMRLGQLTRKRVQKCKVCVRARAYVRVYMYVICVCDQNAKKSNNTWPKLSQSASTDTKNGSVRTQHQLWWSFFLRYVYRHALKNILPVFFFEGRQFQVKNHPKSELGAKTDFINFSLGSLGTAEGWQKKRGRDRIKDREREREKQKERKRKKETETDTHTDWQNGIGKEFFVRAALSY